MSDMQKTFLAHSQLDAFFQKLRQSAYRVIGPQARDGAIVYADLDSAQQLPWGLRDRQASGSYQLENTNRKRAFAFALGNQGIKPFLFKAEEVAWRVERDKQGRLIFKPASYEEPPIAFFGARSCDLHALAVQDKVFLDGAYSDPGYQQRRAKLLLIAVNCSYSSANCFCMSAGGSPEVQHQADMVLSEIDGGFIIEQATDSIRKLLEGMTLKAANLKQQADAKRGIKQAKKMQTKRIPYDNQSALQKILFEKLDHPRWDQVAERCLSCGNCTSACPTCFCHSQVENADLDGQASTHIKQWDSCFNAGHSYVGKTILRNDTKSRYKQWLTHKVGSWFEQFGTSGCVGCGRCIAWCPSGIDLTEELAAITGESNQRGDNESS